MFRKGKVFGSHTKGLYIQLTVLWDGDDKEATLRTLPYSPESKKHKDIIHLCFSVTDCLAGNLRTNTAENNVASAILL